MELSLLPGDKVVHKGARRHLVIGTVVGPSPDHGGAPWVLVKWGSEYAVPIAAHLFDLRRYKDSA